MPPKPTLSPSFPRRQIGRLRWPLAWLLALALTAGMLLLLAGIVPARPRTQAAAPETLSASLQAPRPTAPSAAPTVAKHAALATAPRRTEAPQPPILPAPPVLAAETPAQTQRPQTRAPPLAPESLAESPSAPAQPPAGANPGTAKSNAEKPAHTDAAQLSKLPLAQRCPQQVKPVFPAIAREDFIEQGQVRARLHLAADGKVRALEILQASPAGYFEAASRRAALQWRCLPSGEAGDSVIASFVFRLE